MARRRKTIAPPRRVEQKAEKPVFDSPFKDLKKMLGVRPIPSAPLPASARSSKTAPAAPRGSKSASAAPEPSPADDEAMFRQAVEGVRPLGGSRATRIAPNPEINREIVSEDAEVLARLSDLIAGQGHFELTETDEYVEGARVGIDPRLLTRLRRAEFAVQAHIDLHGMIQSDAKEALERFILDAVRKGMRTVLVVHGRGLRSPGGTPVLKHAAAQWLSHGLIGGYVLAFSTARPADGGAGAMYVLLRRERRRAPFDILHGARRRD
ncbi:MAG TPA: Smr/MutS family protein [Candidatus Binataceae bacterium]|nr:Smr/MutS family protein [Candidatus Binataceae bacterium]